MTQHSDKGVTTTSCPHFILDVARSLDHAFTYKDLLTGTFKYGTLRNSISKLRKHGEILKLPKENPARFILKEWSNRLEYKRWINDDKSPMRVGQKIKVDFVSFVESLGWDELAYVHDVRLEFDTNVLTGVCSSNGWEYSKRNHGWSRKFYDFEFPLTIQVYNTKHVQVLVECSLKPVPFSFKGLIHLTSVLGELKGKLGWSFVPNVADWLVTSWHYGKDSHKEVSGASFNVTFETWSKTLARIYVKSKLKKVRVEEIQSPRRPIQELFEKVMNID